MIWCYSCSQQTTISPYANKCSTCGSFAIEFSNQTSSSPILFRPYVIGSNEQLSNGGDNQIDSSQGYQQIEIPITFHIQTIVLQSIERPGVYTVFRILSTGQPDTKTPVSKQVFDKLQRVDNVKECSICQDEGGHGLKLNCSHCFHDNCLKPWVQQANTCPTCRSQIKL